MTDFIYVGGQVLPIGGFAVGYLDARTFGAAGTGLVDDAPALSALFAKAASVASSAPGGICDVFLPGGTYLLQSMLSFPPRVRLYGSGNTGNATTTLTAGGSFSGPALLDLVADSLAATSHYQSQISGLRLVAGGNGSGLAAVRCVQPFLTNSWLHNLSLTGGVGLQFGSNYTQMCLIEDILGIASIDQMMKLAGNINTIRRVDTTQVVSSRSTSTLPILHITTAAPSFESVGNIIEQCVIEGNIGLNQAPLRIDGGATNTVLINFWVEDPLGGNGHYAEFVGAGPVRILGTMQNIGSSGGAGRTYKLYARTTQYVFIDGFRSPAQDVSFASLFDFDNSPLRIQQAALAYGYDTYPLLNFDNTIPVVEVEGATMVVAGTIPGLLPQQRLDSGMKHNLLTNGSFDAGLYGWTVSGGAGESDVFQSGTVGPGQGWHSPFNANPGAHILIYQTITINSAQLNFPLTFSIKAQIGSGSGSHANIWIDGCGIAGTNLTGHVQRLGGNTGWVILTQSFVPTAAGALHVGVEIPQNGWASTGDVLWLDEANLCFGMVGTCAQAYCGSLVYASGAGGDDVGLPQLYSSAAPATGTWPAGAIVWNNAPTSGGFAGWVCTVAGSPGTWKTWGLIS